MTWTICKEICCTSRAPVSIFFLGGVHSVMFHTVMCCVHRASNSPGVPGKPSQDPAGVDSGLPPVEVPACAVWKRGSEPGETTASDRQWGWYCQGVWCVRAPTVPAGLENSPCNKQSVLAWQKVKHEKKVTQTWQIKCQKPHLVVCTISSCLCFTEQAGRYCC